MRTGRGRALSLAALAAVAYVPLLLTQPGWVGADTKHYLYLDPWRLLQRAASVWDPSIGLGTVSHQNIGYLWPMGPWYAAFDWLGTPDWVAQRLWLATIFFAAGAGTLFLLRLLGLTGTGAFVGAFAYQLTPYVLTYAARITAILLPWAGLPWLLAFTILALRRGGWRWPAAIALLTTTIGSINASSLLYAAFAAALWIPFAVVHLREVTWRAAARTVARTGALVAVTQLWWVVALVLSGSYGPPVLETTETLEAVSTSSVTSEVARSLGNWFFYGADAIGPWVQAAADYQTEGWLIAVTFAIPMLALAGAAVTRWAYRGYFLALVAAGAVVAVAAHPFDDPSPLGALTKAAADSSSLALALRNAQRATPLLCLGFAALLGAGVAAVGRRVDRGEVLAAVAATSLVALGLPSLWIGGLVDPNLRRPETIPSWNVEAAAALDAATGTAPERRVFELPGSDFAAFRWGNTIDPLLPGMIDRPWVSRESAPQGTAGTISLVTAVDRRLQEGVLEPEALAAVARLTSSGDLLVRADLQTERYRTPRPRALAGMLRSGAPGLDEPRGFGEPAPNVGPPTLPLVDEIALGLPQAITDPSPLTSYRVRDAPPIVHALPTASPVVVDGDGEGLVELAAAGLIDGRELVVYGPTAVANRDTVLERGDDRRPVIVVTDTNRKRAHRFTQLRENYGYTEAAGDSPLVDDPADARIDLFPGFGDDARTVARVEGVRSVRATGYGNTVTYIPEERPVNAVDGDPTTAWRVGAFESPVGHRLRVELDEPQRIEGLQLTQPLDGDRNRWITRVAVVLDGNEVAQVDLDDRSRAIGGQRVELEPTTAEVVELRVVADSAGKRPGYVGLSAVGFAEVSIPGVSAAEWIRLPRTVLRALGSTSTGNPLAFVLSRLRANPAEPVRSDPERAMARIVELPAARSFAVAGTARIAATVDDATVDRLLGLPDAAAGGITARSSSRLPGSLTSRASSAVDGDRATSWTPAFLAPGEQWLEVTAARPFTFDRIDLTVVADGRHSVPTSLRLEAGGAVRHVELTDVPESAPGGRVTLPVAFEPLSSDGPVKVAVTGTRTVPTVDWFSRAQVPLPIAIAELGIPGVERRPLPRDLMGECRSDLLTVDGSPVPLALRGSAAAAEARGGLDLVACGAPSVDLAAGEHRVRTAPGLVSGIDVDRLVFRSEAGGGATADPRARLVANGDVPPGVDHDRTSRSSHRARVGAVTEPVWLVLGESWSEGWEAVANGRSLGPPVLVSGYANAWLLDPAVVGDGPVDVTLRWRPQRLVEAALAVSALGALICIALVAWPRRRFRSLSRLTVAESATVSLESRETGAHGPDWDPVPPDAPRLAARARALLIAALAALAAIAAGPLFALPAALLALAATSDRRALRAAPATVALGAIGLCALGTFALQMRNGYAPGFHWAENFDRLHPIGWLVFVAIAVEAAAAWTIRTDRREPGSTATEDA
ncbi:MAG TPA: alpha-(1-_3)-arabinofuranosyltransferase family protein [Acidimicrobiales bacterium]